MYWDNVIKLYEVGLVGATMEFMVIQKAGLQTLPELLFIVQGI